MKKDIPKRTLKILKARVAGKSWEHITRKFGISESYAKECVDYLMDRAVSITDLATAFREFTVFKNIERDLIKQEMSEARRGLDAAIKEVKAQMKKINKVFRKHIHKD